MRTMSNRPALKPPIPHAPSVKRSDDVTEQGEILKRLSEAADEYRESNRSQHKNLRRIVVCAYRQACLLKLDEAEWAAFIGADYWEGIPRRPKMKHQASPLSFVLRLVIAPRDEDDHKHVSLLNRALTEPFKNLLKPEELETLLKRKSFVKLASEATRRRREQRAVAPKSSLLQSRVEPTPAEADIVETVFLLHPRIARQFFRYMNNHSSASFNAELEARRVGKKIVVKFVNGAPVR